MSLAACSPRSPLSLSCNNEIAFHSDGAAGGLWDQRVIKGLVALISSDPPWMAAVTLCQRGDLRLCGRIPAAAAVSLRGIPLADMMDRYFGYSVNPH